MTTHIETATPTLDTSAYASGDHMGSLMTLETGLSGNYVVKLNGVQMLNAADSAVAFDILFFNETPTIASSDNGALNITDAEMAKCVGHVEVAATDFVDYINSQGIALNNLGLNMKSADNGKLYALLVARGAVTYAASSLSFRFAFEINK